MERLVFLREIPVFPVISIIISEFSGINRNFYDAFISLHPKHTAMCCAENRRGIWLPGMKIEKQLIPGRSVVGQIGLRLCPIERDALLRMKKRLVGGKAKKTGQPTNIRLIMGKNELSGRFRTGLREIGVGGDQFLSASRLDPAGTKKRLHRLLTAVDQSEYVLQRMDDFVQIEAGNVLQRARNIQFCCPFGEKGKIEPVSVVLDENI